ncbi:MAG TPA: glycine betaine ABC transporter substrate-binding protein [Rhodothermales bacterium]|nr:glycine betaine ABC transporter substrate-binding protein [Rhodothermales bacterium]
MSTRKHTEDKATTQQQERMPRYVLVGIAAYELLVIALLAWELYISSFRSTDQVLLLLALSILPVVLEGVRLIFSKIKIGDIELTTREWKQLKTDVKKIENLQKSLIGSASTADLALYPLIGGPDAFARDRLTRDRPHLIIGSKDFAANIVVARLLEQFIKESSLDVHVDARIPNGGTVTNYASLINGWIDLFVGYTGTGCLFLRIDPRGKTQDAIHDELNNLSKARFQFEWLPPLGTRTNYCLVIRKEAAEKNGVEQISDLRARNGTLRFCGNYEFMNRYDGLLGLKAKYQLRFARESVCSYDARYTLLDAEEADLTDGYTTDLEITELDLIQLDDDKAFFPHYMETPIARSEALDTVEGLRETLEAFSELNWENEDIRYLIQEYRDGHLDKAVESTLASKLNAQARS